MANLNLEAAADLCCASCGIAEVDDIKLNECNDCDLVHYCSEKCQQDHEPDHEAMCKERAAELRDEILFKQPESTHMGDCPICCLPLPLELKPSTSTIMGCCSKWICIGCAYANNLRETEAGLQQTCPFCRHPVPKTKKEAEMNIMKRVAANDRVAIHHEGTKHLEKGDCESAFEYYTKAAELGDASAHFLLSLLYEEGRCVEKDEEKELYHLEEAAIAGHPDARYNIGCDEERNKRFDRAVKHWIIAANLGHEKSMQGLKEFYKHGLISKEDFAAALRANHAAVHAAKSPQREAANTRRLGTSQIAG